MPSPAPIDAPETKSSMIIRALILLCAAALLAPTAARASGAWNVREGGYYIKVGGTWLEASEEFDRSGDRRPLFSDTARFHNGEFGATYIGVHAELGITDWLTGVISTQFNVAVREARYVTQGRDTTLSASGLGDIWLNARVRLLPADRPLAASVTLGMKAPTGAPLQPIPLGTGVIDYSIAAAVGMPFTIGETIGARAQLALGYRLRNKASNDLTYAAEAGVDLGGAVHARTIIDGVHSTADFAAIPDDAVLRQSLVGDQSFTRLTLGVIGDVAADMELHVAYARRLTGRNSLASGSFSIGVVWKTP